MHAARMARNPAWRTFGRHRTVEPGNPPTFVAMRRPIAIALLALFAFTGTEAHQLLKLPMLFQHYAEHQAEGSMDWWHFLEEHYLHERHRHASDERHHELPFHCDHHCGAQTVQISVDQPAVPIISLPAAADARMPVKDDRIPSLHGPADIWQPPRA